MKKRLLMLFAAFLVLTTACGSENDTDGTDADEGEGVLSGEIKVITQRTDIVDTVFPEYAARFNEIYPNIKINFEALADYGSQIAPRMNTKDYGDVLLIPPQVPIADIPTFFEPLGNLEELQDIYMGIEERAVSGQVYGIPIAMSYTGIVYNKAVFEEAGITDVPKTIDEFLNVLQRVKDKTDAIPLYTNYAAGWPLTQWEGAITTVVGDVDYYNVTMPNQDDLFVQGKPHYDMYKLMYEVANRGLIENDPITTDWESSKAMMGRGEIATMVLGSWAIEQIKGFSENPDDIGYMPFPTNAKKILFPLGSDYQIAVNKNSKNKEASLAWLEWFIHESGYSVEQAGGISAAKDVPLPAYLVEYEAQGVEFTLLTPAKTGQEGLVDKIDKEADIGFWLDDNKKRIVEAAIGYRKETFDDIANDLNERWNAARKKVSSDK